MIVQTKQSPDFKNLILTLKSQFPNYSVYTYLSATQRSIIVRKSAAVGAQITIHDKEILVDACCPNILISAIVGFISTIFPPYHNFEMKMTDFLKKKYN